MLEMMKNQKYGVEIEFTGITRAKAAEIVASQLGSRVVGPDSSCYHTRKIADSKRRTWKIMRDSSINPERNDNSSSPLDEYRVEFVTPPLNYEDIEKLQEIVRAFREAGGKPNSSCGIHIHVDGANHNASSLRRLVNFMTARQDLIYEALNIGARGDRWCRKLSPEILSEMKKNKSLNIESAERIWYSPANDGYCSGVNHEHYNPTRYHGVNLHSFFSKGTVEFRLFNSTLHAGKIKTYVQFCLAVSAMAIESTDRMSFKSTAGYTAEQKVTLMRNVLVNRLGLGGDEFRTCRQWMMEALRKSAQNANSAAA